MQKARVMVSFTEQQLAWLDQEKTRTGESRNELIRRAVDFQRTPMAKSLLMAIERQNATIRWLIAREGAEQE